MQIQQHTVKTEYPCPLQKAQIEKAGYMQADLAQNQHVSVALNKTGHWNQKEQAKYFAFLNKFEHNFQEKLSRRHFKVFKAMAEFIGTRNANQCRSHHHKMSKNFGSIRETLQFLQAKNPHLKPRCEKYTHQLEKISILQRDEQLQALPLIAEHQFVHEPQGAPRTELLLQSQNLYKPIDIGNLRTDTTFNGIQQHAIQYNLGAFTPQSSCFKGFPTTGLLTCPSNPLLQSQSDFGYFSEFQYANFIAEEEPQPVLTTQQKWVECHEYFIKWVNKLTSLIEEEQGSTLFRTY